MEKLIQRIKEELIFSKENYNRFDCQNDYWNGRRCLCEELLWFVEKEGLL